MSSEVFIDEVAANVKDEIARTEHRIPEYVVTLL